MDWNSILGTTFANGGLAQYPNKNVYNAAKLLGREDRPTVPVRVVKPTDYYDSPAAREGRVGAFVMPDRRDNVYVAENADIYKNPRMSALLGAALAHEQQHIRGLGELEGYKKEYDVLRKIGRNRHPKEVERLRNIIRAYEAK